MEDIELHATRLEIRMLMDMLGRSAKRDLERRLSQAEVQISSLQYIVLRLLNYQSYTASELSRALNHDPNTLVQVADSLQKSGLAQREADPRDRRRNPLVITEQGRAILAQIPVIDEQDVLATTLTEMGTTKTNQLLGLLRELGQTLLEQDVLASLPLSASQMIEADQTKFKSE